MRLDVFQARLPTRRPFVTHHGRTEAIDALFARIQDDVSQGWGEAAPAGSITGETYELAKKQLLAWQHGGEDSWGPPVHASPMFPGHGGHPAALNAAVTAALDAQGRREGAPLARLLNLPPGTAQSSITLSLGPLADVLAEAHARDEEGWTAFKVKLGGKHDEQVLQALHDRYPDRRLRVDANEGWSPATARRTLPLLSRLDVELLEQPLPRTHLRESAELARESPIPIVLDEAVTDLQSAIDAILLDAAHGINIKLAKCGGPFEARRIIKALRENGWKVMIGCMVETRLGIATAAAFTAAADWLDLDGSDLLKEDAFEGWQTPAGRVETPDGPGVGVQPTHPLSPVA